MLQKRNKILDYTLVFLVRVLLAVNSFRCCCPSFRKYIYTQFEAYWIILFILHIYIGASYFVGRFLASLFWGVVADRIGRKPIIIFSVLSVWAKCSCSRNYTNNNALLFFNYMVTFILSLVMHYYSRVIVNTLFGLSTKYWMAITTRLILGALNGMLAPIKVFEGAYIIWHHLCRQLLSYYI